LAKGLINTVADQNLLYHDVSFDKVDTNGQSLGMPPLYANLTKPANVPDLYSACLWADKANQKFYQYGGGFDNGIPMEFELWVYDVYNDVWSSINTTTFDDGSDVSRLYDGAAVAVEDRAEGYYLGGYIGPESQYNWAGSVQAVSNLLIYDMLGNTWRNQSGPDGIPRAEGVMLYLPAGDGGVLVAFGGIQTKTGQPHNATPVCHSQTMLH